jgi:hypothetical protein
MRYWLFMQSRFMSLSWSGAPGLVGASFAIMPTMVFMLLSTTAAMSSASLSSRLAARVVSAVLIPASTWLRKRHRISVQSVLESMRAVNASIFGCNLTSKSMRVSASCSGVTWRASA